MDAAELSAKSAARSCTTCSKAKAKCVRPPGALICDRCARLKKECQSKEPVLRRKKPTKTTRAAQLEKLEHKIEHLVNALSTNTQQQAQPHRVHDYEKLSPPISQVSSTMERAITRSGELLGAMCHGPEGSETSASPEGPRIHETQGTTAKDASQHPPVVLSLHEADVMLDRYVRLMARGLPFVVLPDGSNARSMREKRPVLLQAICVVAYYHDLTKQQILVGEAIASIGERVLVKGEKSVDIVQAILVLAAWYHPHIFWGAQVTNLLHIAMAVSIDLGIDRRPQLQDFKQMTTRAMHGPCLTHRVPSLEERRVLLGLFQQTSMLSATVNKINAMSFTLYMEECLDALSQAREYDSDLTLVQLVEIQRVVQAAHSAGTSSAPPKMFIKAFQADLQRLRKDDRTEDENIFVKLQYLTADISIWQVTLATFAENNKPRRLSNHIEDLYHLVDAVKRFFDVWWTIPVTSYLLLPFSCFGQYAYAFINLTKVAGLDIDGWDLNAVNEHINFMGVIDESIERYDAATRIADDTMTIKNDAFARWALRVKWMKQVYETKSAAVETPSQVSDIPGQVGDKGVETKQTEEPNAGGTQQEQQQQQQQQQIPMQQQTPPDDFLSADFFGYLDEGFWTSFGGGDYDMFLPALHDSIGNMPMIARF